MKTAKVFFHFLRFILATTYLWVVADRLGILGPVGNMGVVWGDFQNFLDYTATLNPWFPRGLSDFLGYFVTFLELTLAFLLISGIRLKQASLASLILLLIFTLSMTFSLGIKETLDFIVFTIVLAFASGYVYWIEKHKKV